MAERNKGVERIRRRKAQEGAKEQGLREAANLDVATAKANAPKKVEPQVAPTRRVLREQAQAKNAEQARIEGARVSENVRSPLANLRPGEQVDARTARLYMRQQGRQQRDEVLVAATMAGRAVRDVLNGRDPGRSTGTRFKKAARHAKQAAQAATKTE